MLIAAAIAGCSVSRYDESYKSRIAAFREDAVFAGLDAAPRELAEGGRVHVHVPLKFTPVDEESRDASLRFMRKLDGAMAFNVALTGTSGFGSRPVVAVAAVPVANRRPDDLKREIGGWIEAERNVKGLKWEQKKVVPSRGGPADWFAVPLDGNQIFEAVEPGSQELRDREMKGVGQLWVSASPDHDMCVVVCVRVPEDVASQVGNTPEELAELMARRIEILPPEPDAQAAK